MNFLNEIFLNNTVKSYCIVGSTILLMLILKRYFSRYIASLLYRLFGPICKTVGKKSFTGLVVMPLEWLLFIVIAVFAIDKLNFPTAWQYKIYGHGIEDILARTGNGIIIISFALFLLRIIDFIALVLEQKASATADKTDDQLVVFFRDFLKVIVLIIGILFIVKTCFNHPIGNLLTSLSIVGAAMALAAKESLENLIASFIIFFDKPFTIGDTLKVNAVIGTVEKIGLRSTRIRTADKTLITVPNKQMVDSIVDNWSLRTHRRAEIKLELSVATPATSLQAVIKAIKARLQTDTQYITSSTVYLAEVSNTGNTIIAEYFTPAITMEEFIEMKENHYFFILQMLEENQMVLSRAFNLQSIINKQPLQV
jgi:MscS family membrane protein